MRLALTATLALLMAAPAHAIEWTVDPAQSSITFEASQSGQPFTGTLPAFKAEITLDTSDLPNARIKVTMPLAGMTTGSSTRDADLPKADWFDLANHPEAIFESSKITAVDENGQYVADGTLTIRGISQPLTLPFDLVLEDEMARATASVRFSRMPFGVGKGWPESSGVSENIKVNIEIFATRDPLPVTPSSAR